MILANLDRKEFVNLESNDEALLFDFVSALLVALTSTPPLATRPKLHSYQARWCAERVVGCYDLKEFMDWLASRGDDIDGFTNQTIEFMDEYQMKRGVMSKGVH